MGKEAGKYMTAAEVLACMRERFSPPAWAFLAGVRNGTGYARGTVRTADAIAMSLYPSRGLDLYGFEVKVSKGDWKRELADPEKAEDIARFMDFWYVVAPPGIVEPDELPPAWGLMETSGSTVRTKKEARKMEPVPVDRLFLGSLLRAASEGSVPKSAFNEVLHAKIEEKEKQWEEHKAWRSQQLEKEVADLKKQIADFQAASGVDIDRWNVGEIGALVKTIVGGGLVNWLPGRINHVVELLDNATKACREAESVALALRKDAKPAEVNEALPSTEAP